MGHGTQIAALLLAGFFVSATTALYTSSSPVVSLDSSNIKAKLKSSGLALVEFYAPWCGHCKQLTPEYEKAAKATKGFVTIAAVDADADKALAQEYGIQGFPTIKLLYMDGDKIKSMDYQGGRTAKDMIPWVFEKAKNLALKRLGEKASTGGGKKDSGSKGSKPSGGAGAGSDSFYDGTEVVTLTDSNWSEQVTGSQDLWLVEFYAPWCGHCKNLKPQWIEAASDLKGKVKVGAVDCTQHQSTCSEYGVQGYPTIKFFGQRKSSPEDYNGAREAAAIVSFATDKWSRQAPPPEVVELTSQSVWDKHCSGGKGSASLCLIAFLPDILDSKASGRNKYISILKRISDQYKDRPYAYLWAQGGSQPGLEANLGVGGFGYPAFVAFRSKDNKYSLAREAFEEGHVKDFLDGLKHGKHPVLAVQGSLASIVTVPAWDGKDAAVQLEDEFSLDDLNEL